MHKGNFTPGLVVQRKTVTPHDTTGDAKFGNLFANCFWQSATGDVTVVGDDGTDHAYPGALGGMWHNAVPFSIVKDTGTTATSVIVGRTA